MRLLSGRRCARGGRWTAVAVACAAIAGPVAGARAQGDLPWGNLPVTPTSFGFDDLVGPGGVAVDPATGTAYVADTGRNRIDVFNAEGVFQAAWGWGVTDGADHYEICTDSCLPGLAPPPPANPGAGQLNRPRGIAFDPATGDVYVADTGDGRVEVFSSAGAYLAQIGSPGTGDGQVVAPTGVAVDAATGSVYVADGQSEVVQVFTTAGTYVSQFGSFGTAGGQFEALQDIAVDPATGDVYTVENATARVQQFSASGGFIRAWGWDVDGDNGGFEVCTSSCAAGTQGGGAGQLSSEADGVTVDPTDGDVYVADGAYARVQVFSASGAYLSQFGSNTASGGSFTFPIGLTVDPGTGDVYVADNTIGDIQVFSPSGGDLARLATSGAGAGQLADPAGTAVGANGDVYVADPANQRIDVFGPSGAFLMAWGWGVADGAKQLETCTTTCRAGIQGPNPGQFDHPESVAVDPATGNVWVADTGNNRLQEFTASGGFVGAFGSHGSGAGQVIAPAGIAVSEYLDSGIVWVADTGNNRLDAFFTDGSFMQALGWGVTGANGFHSCTKSCSAGHAAQPGGAVGSGQLSSPAGVAVDQTTGDVYVSDTGHARVQEYDADGGRQAAWGWDVDGDGGQLETCTPQSTVCQAGTSGTGAGQLTSPSGVAVDSTDGEVYVERGEPRIDAFSTFGAYLSQFGSFGAASGQFTAPTGVAVDPASGTAYVTDDINSTLDAFGLPAAPACTAGNLTAPQAVATAGTLTCTAPAGSAPTS